MAETILFVAGATKYARPCIHVGKKKKNTEPGQKIDMRGEKLVRAHQCCAHTMQVFNQGRWVDAG
jgi:hypothetical protein